LFVEREGLFEFRAGDTVADSRGDLAQIQALRNRVRRAQKAFGSAPDVRGSREVRLRTWLGHFKKQDARVGRQQCEEIFGAGGIKFLTGIEREHPLEDTPGEELRGEAEGEKRKP
jgi:hypothetical protein